METLSALPNRTTNSSGPLAAESIDLVLSISDQNVMKYLTAFDEDVRKEKALEALRVGVIAIQSASPSLDTKIVEEKFRQVEVAIDRYLNGFQTDLTGRLEEFFKVGSGTVPRSLDSFLGSNGTMPQMMNQYFSSDGGRLHRLIQDQVGPSSSFAKSLDPENKESVLSKLETLVQGHLQQKTTEIINQFSLDIDNSALSRLQKSLFEKVGEIQQANTTFFGELKQALGIKTGKDTESERGTEKGREFETLLYDPVAAMARQLGDTSENVRSLVGKIPRSKVGDHILTLGITSGAPGLNVVIEVKKEQGYKLKSAIEELKTAKENREAEAGIFVFAKGYEPAEVGDFYRLGNDFYITVDEEQLRKNEPLLFLEASYKIIRVILVTSRRIQDAREIDVEKIKRELEGLVALTVKLSDIQTKANTIKSSSEKILDTATSLRTELETRLNDVIGSL